MKTLEELGISPTPWSAESYDEVDHHYVVDNSEYAIFLLRRSKNGKANARFIAAAPKMYERLSEAVNDKCTFCNSSEDDKRELCDQCIVADWKEALAEASGEVSNV